MHLTPEILGLEEKMAEAEAEEAAVVEVVDEEEDEVEGAVEIVTMAEIKSLKMRRLERSGSERSSRMVDPTLV